jgi:epoxyqueuosine reductase
MVDWLQRVKEKAVDLGFSMVGVTPAVPSPQLDAYLRWIEAGYHGAMGYMARPDRVARRRDLNVIVPGARSLIVVGLDYQTVVPREILTDPSRGRISAYALGRDYHDIMTPRLQALADWLRVETRSDIASRVYVDTGALLERSHASQAGFGFTGKNTMLIHPRRGSLFFLGEVITTFPFSDYDDPYPPPNRGGVTCGACTRCLNACPTGAFPQPHVLDARRCISYLTIELKGAIPPDLRPLLGNWVYGCDVCQTVCPFNRFAVPAAEPAFAAMNVERAAPPLVDLLALTPEAFKARFADSPILRIKRDRLVRNACIAAGNWGDPSVVPLLDHLLADPSDLVREHAAWALTQCS